LSLVVHGSHEYTLRIDWTIWCHVMKFEISLGLHPYTMTGIFDVMLWSLRYHLGLHPLSWLESLMPSYEVWDITWVAPLCHDLNLWCHVIKFEISIGSHPFPMVEIFDVMLWSLRYHLGCTLCHDWNLWCHVMKFEISLGLHRYAMIGIFDIMLWSLRYQLGRTLSPWLESSMSCHEVW
jgi:hypothetical protein